MAIGLCCVRVKFLFVVGSLVVCVAFLFLEFPCVHWKVVYLSCAGRVSVCLSEGRVFFSAVPCQVRVSSGGDFHEVSASCYVSLDCRFP